MRTLSGICLGDRSDPREHPRLYIAIMNRCGIIAMCLSLAEFSLKFRAYWINSQP